MSPARAADARPAVVGIDDATLVLAARAGDRTAEERLVTRHAQALATIAARLIGSKHDAEDVAQDAFIAAFTRLDRLRDPALFRPWLMRIAVMRVREVIRRRRIARTLGIDIVVPDVTLESAVAPSVSGDTRAELALLDRVLDRISADLRIAWMLRHVEGMELEDVAEACGCSLATAKRRIAAADERVRAHVRFASDEEDV